MSTLPDPVFFTTPARWRAWLKKHHATAAELHVGFHKRATGNKSITWPESVDQALCFGWIDGVRRRIDDATYMIRFTPRRDGSIWSAINIRRVAELDAEGLMEAAGRTAFGKRTTGKSAVYAYEQREHAALTPAQMKLFRAQKAAWKFFESQPAWYRRVSAWWVISAKQAATRERRLQTLIDESAAGRTIREVPPRRK
jgi:uncharacterized protein YdeI (YjbR/CyaY-like superfamily)